MEMPFTAYAEDIREKRDNRERFRRYYESHREEFREKNKQRYQAKKEQGIGEEELEKRRADNRRSYYRRREREIRAQLEAMRQTTDASRMAILDELIADNAFSQWGKDVLDVVAFILRKKETSSEEINGPPQNDQREEETEGSSVDSDSHRLC